MSILFQEHPHSWAFQEPWEFSNALKNSLSLGSLLSGFALHHLHTVGAVYHHLSSSMVPSDIASLSP